METPEGEKFRDSIGTIDKEGKRAWVFPKKPAGKLYKYRKIVSYVLLTILISSPFIKVNSDDIFVFLIRNEISVIYTCSE